MVYMKDRQTTHGLNPEKILELLKLGSDINTHQTDAEQQKADLLNDRLNEILPIDLAGEEKGSKKENSIRHTISMLTNEPIGKLLLEPKTESFIIKMIKDYSKSLSKKSKTEADHQIANTIYYAAIAHALVYHNIKITLYSLNNLQQSFLELSIKNWIPKSLLALFGKACEYCKTKKELT
jgi:hypothetical protein